MARYFVKTSNLRGATVSAPSNASAEARLGTLKPDVSKYDAGKSEQLQANVVVVELFRYKLNGELILNVNTAQCDEPVTIFSGGKNIVRLA